MVAFTFVAKVAFASKQDASSGKTPPDLASGTQSRAACFVERSLSQTKEMMQSI